MHNVLFFHHQIIHFHIFFLPINQFWIFNRFNETIGNTKKSGSKSIIYFNAAVAIDKKFL